MTTKSLTKSKNGLGVKMALDVLNETNKPMSILGIMKKYEIKPPFQVRLNFVMIF